MPRPQKIRNVGPRPPATRYKPAGISAADLPIITLTLDEYEAVRLIDGGGMQQDEVAELMGISRPTVTRIIASSRSKLASMLIEPAVLLIEGGRVRRHAGRGPGGRGQGKQHRRNKRG